MGRQCWRQQTIHFSSESQGCSQSPCPATTYPKPGHTQHIEPKSKGKVSCNSTKRWRSMSSRVPSANRVQHIPTACALVTGCQKSGTMQTSLTACFRNGSIHILSAPQNRVSQPKVCLLQFTVPGPELLTSIHNSSAFRSLLSCLSLKRMLEHCWYQLLAGMPPPVTAGALPTTGAVAAPAVETEKRLQQLEWRFFAGSFACDHILIICYCLIVPCIRAPLPVGNPKILSRFWENPDGWHSSGFGTPSHSKG
jgi:hypothetical protein